MKPRGGLLRNPNWKCQGRLVETIRVRKKYLRGVEAGFELARKGLRANPNRVFCEEKGKVTPDSFAKVKNVS